MVIKNVAYSTWVAGDRIIVIRVFNKSISPPQNLAHRLQHMLVSRGSFGFVFVWVLVLSFTYAMCELIFFVCSRLFLARVQTDVCTQASLFSVRFFSECVEFPSPYFQFVQEYCIFK